MRLFFTVFATLSLLLIQSAYAENDKDSILRGKIAAKYKELSKKFSCHTMTAAILQEEMKNNNVILIDIRSEKEIKVSKLPGAITEKEFVKNLQKYKKQNKKLVAYCTIGYRSGLFAEKYKSIKVYNLLGGVLMWSHLNGEFVNKNGPVKEVHTYSEDWNFLNSNYIAVTK